MAVITREIKFQTKGNTDILDITADVSKMLNSLKIDDGIVNIHACGSTGAITTCEYEDGLIEDIKAIFDKLIPSSQYNHDKAWGDGNGHSHLRASLVGPSLTVPFSKKELVLGTWQQIIFIDFDNRGRNRKILLQFIGE